MAEENSSDSVKGGKKHVVENMIADLTGGRELDMTGVTTEFDGNQGYIPEGTPIILDGGVYKPLLEANKGSGDDGGKVVGFLFDEIKATSPYAVICIKGVVNEAKLPFTLDASSKTAVQGAIVFV